VIIKVGRGFVKVSNFGPLCIEFDTSECSAYCKRLLLD